MGEPSGFTWEARASGEVVIRHHGRLAATLRGRKADRFRAEVEAKDADDAVAQDRMARLTGNYKHGNERRR